MDYFVIKLEHCKWVSPKKAHHENMEMPFTFNIDEARRYRSKKSAEQALKTFRLKFKLFNLDSAAVTKVRTLLVEVND